MKTPGRIRHRSAPGQPAIKYHPDYQVWNGMIGRCMNPGDRIFHLYGAKGITVCDRWMNFWHFTADMGPRPTPRHSIDRIENSKGYEPGNCRWATKREQTLNRSITRNIEFQGAKKCLTDWASEMGISVNGLRDRIEDGWSIEDALTKPKRPVYHVLEFMGRRKSISEWAIEIGLSRSALSTRVKKWGVEKALTTGIDPRVLRRRGI